MWLPCLRSKSHYKQCFFVSWNVVPSCVYSGLALTLRVEQKCFWFECSIQLSIHLAARWNAASRYTFWLYYAVLQDACCMVMLQGCC